MMRQTKEGLRRKPVPEFFLAGMLRIDPTERCDPRFAELNAAIAAEDTGARPHTVPHGAVKKQRLEEAAARMRAKYTLRSIRQKAARDGWKTRRGSGRLA